MKRHVKLRDEDREYLGELIKSNRISSRKYKRALVVLELEKGKTYQEVGKLVGIVQQTASIWANRYKKEGLGFLVDKKPPGRPAEISGEERAKITALACSKAPEGYEKWSLRLLADRVVELGIMESISHTEVGRILKKTS